MEHKIMVVDDTAFMRMMLKNIITAHGYEVVEEVGNGLEAVEKYGKAKPDLVTMDITMPEMDGITAIKEIKKIDPDAKIIVCSAMGQKSLVIDALEAGAKDFIVKPFESQRVTNALDKVLKGTNGS